MYSNRLTFKEKVKEKIEFTLHYGPWMILWCLLFAILFFGFNEALFFIPDSWVEYDEYGDYLYKTKSFFAFILSVALVSWAFHLYFKYRDENKTLKQAIKLLRSNDKNLLAKLKRSNPGNYDTDRDIPLSLILEKRGQIFDFHDYSGPTTMHNFMERDPLWGSKPPIYDKVRKILEDATDFDLAYRKASELEKLILENLPTKIKDKYKKEIYYLRVNFLDMYLNAAFSGNFLTIGGSNKKVKPLEEFYKMVLNEFYEDAKNYKKQKTDFNVKEFEEVLKDS